MDDEEASRLVRDALAGDQDALTRLVALLTPVIQSRVVRMLLARRRRVYPEKEDLTQDIFLYLFSRDAHVLRSWEAEMGLSLENFVGFVSERYVMSFLRSGKRNRWKEEPVPDEDLDGTSLDPGPEEVTASREELRLLLERMWETLSPRGRHVFELLFIEERSVTETMEAAGLSADAVYAWRSRLRRLARELLDELSGKKE